MRIQIFSKQLGLSFLVCLACLPLAVLDPCLLRAQVVSNGITAAASSAWDFSAAATLKAPTSNGAAPTVDGLVSFDSIAHNLVWGSNGATKTGASKSGATIAGDCAKWDGNGNLIDSGAACGSGGGGGGVSSVGGTGPILSSGGSTPAISCPACVLASSPLNSLSIVAGAGSQASQVTNITTDSGLNNLAVPGTITAGTALGSPHGKLALQELSANGAATVGFEAVDSLTASLSLQFPNIVPAANQFMLFPAATGGISQWAWTTFSSTNLTDSATIERYMTVANATTTGTALNKLVKLTAAPSTAVIPATTDTGGVIGIVIGGAGISGNASIANTGAVPCVFDGSTTAGHYAQISSSAAGDCHDAGSTYPTSGQILGRVLSTNGSAGTYSLDLFPAEIQGGSGGVGLNAPSGNGPMKYTGSGNTAQATADDLSSVQKCAASSGSATVYVCNTSPTFTLAADDAILFKADVANTGPVLLNVNSLGALVVMKQGGGTALAANDLLAGQWSLMIFDGSNWQMQSQTGNPAGACPACVTSVNPLSTLNVVAGAGGGQGSQTTNMSTDISLNNLSVPGQLTTGTAVGSPHGKLAMQELPANGSTTVGWESLDTISASLSLQFPNAAPAANQFMLFPAPSSGISQWTWTTFAAASLTDSANLPRNVVIANAATTGTTLNTLTSLTGAPSTAVITPTSAIHGVVGITTAGAGTSGSATIATSGPVSCVFDGATTAGDYAQISSATAGDCHDAGSTYPTAGQIVGRVLSTNGSGGTYGIALFPAEAQGAISTFQGNGAALQRSTGSTTTGDCVEFDANGNTIDAGAACGSGSGGLNAPSGNGPMKYTGSSNTAQATADDLSGVLKCLDSSGSGSAQSCGTSPSFTPAAGDSIIYKTTTANTGDLTLNVNSLGAKHARKWQGAATLSSGDLAAGVYMLATYDGTYWEFYTIGNAPSGGGLNAPSGNGVMKYTGSNNTGQATADDLSLVHKCAAASGSGSAYTCATSPTFTPASEDMILFLADVANTGAATLNVNSSSAAGIKKQGGGTALIANDLLAGQWTVLIFDGTYWQMQGQTGNAATGGGGGTTLSTTGSGYVRPFGSLAYTLGGSGIAANQMDVFQFVCCENGVSIAVNSVSFGLSTGQASSNMAIAVYADSSGACGSLLWNTAGTASTTAGMVNAATSSAKTLTLGTVYWVGISGDTANLAYTVSGSNTSDLLNQSGHPRMGRGAAATWSSGAPTFSAACQTGGLTGLASQNMPKLAFLP